jgi:hypothetical protein
LIAEYYKNLFGPPAASNVTLVEIETQDIPQLSAIENEILIADFTEKEVHNAILQMEKNKAPGQTGSQLSSIKKIGTL